MSPDPIEFLALIFSSPVSEILDPTLVVVIVPTYCLAHFCKRKDKQAHVTFLMPFLLWMKLTRKKCFLGFTYDIKDNNLPVPLGKINFSIVSSFLNILSIFWLMFNKALFIWIFNFKAGVVRFMSDVFWFSPGLHSILECGYMIKTSDFKNKFVKKGRLV